MTVNDVADKMVEFIFLVLGKLFALPYVGLLLDIATTSISCLARLMVGHISAYGVEDDTKTRKPERLLKLFDREDDPACKEVREALSVLAIDHEVYPCPNNQPLFHRSQSSSVNSDHRFYQDALKAVSNSNHTVTDGTNGAISTGSDHQVQLQLPILVDENTGQVYNGCSEKTIAYLWTTYGSNATPPMNYSIWRLFRSATGLNIDLSRVLRPLPMHGRHQFPSKVPKQKLVLHDMESSPFSKIVRETMCSLELPHVSYLYPKGAETKRSKLRNLLSDRLSGFRKATKLVQIPFLFDPNTNVEMLESQDIRTYLRNTYGKGAPPSHSHVKKVM